MHNIDGLVTDTTESGLERIKFNGQAASGELYLQGAHCARWQPAGQQPVLWMSKQSYYEPGKPIRGGVPICFPWFGPHLSNKDAPAHGSARIVKWQLAKAEPVRGGGLRLVCQTTIDPFDVTFEVTFHQQLTLALTTSLPATHAGSERFEDALHSYFSISDIRSIAISGLETVDYIDKVANSAHVQATGAPIAFDAETDRVYAPSTHTCVLHDPGLRRRIMVAKEGSHSTVIWNPWIAKSARMPDFGDDEWPGMVCIETANVGQHAVTLTPGSQHTTKATIEVQPL